MMQLTDPTLPVKIRRWKSISVVRNTRLMPKRPAITGWNCIKSLKLNKFGMTEISKFNLIAWVTRIFLPACVFLLAVNSVYAAPTGYTVVGIDKFNGANGAGNSISQNGTNLGNNFNAAIVNGSTSDFTFESDSMATNAEDQPKGAVIFRYTNSSSFYAVTYHYDQWATGKYMIRLKLNTLANPLGSTGDIASYSFPGGVSSLKITAAGSSIKIWINGKLRIDVTNNALASGSYGFGVGPRFNADGVIWNGVRWTAGCSPRTVSAASATPTVCMNDAMTSITHATTNLTGISSSSGLPAGVTASFASNTISIGGTPTASGTFNYTITPNACGSAVATGTITVAACPAATTMPLYLLATGVPSSTLSNTAASATTLLNYDSGRDAFAGLLIQKGAENAAVSDPVKYQRWLSGSSVVHSGSLELRFWSAMKDFNNSKKGVVTAYLRDCNSSGIDCVATPLAVKTLTVSPWSGGSSTWVQKTLSFGDVNLNLGSTRRLELKLIVDSASDDDMWFAYGTTTFNTVLASATPSPRVEVLVVAGGGGGGKNGGGGGGAGGVIHNLALPVEAGAYPVTVGAGGAGSATNFVPASNGQNSSFASITALGGGGGSSRDGGSAALARSAGTTGSGGGGAGGMGTRWERGFGTSGQGNHGGNGTGSPDLGVNAAGGGGGGAGAVGTAGASRVAGDGGAGVANSITGTSVTYGGGGGGGLVVNGTGTGQGGAGGGGNGGRQNAEATDGTANTGGGGGGGWTISGSGGSGIVILRYKTDGSDGINAATTTGGTKTTWGIYTIHTFTASGTLTVNATGPDHLEIQHASGAGLTCTPSTVTVKACADAACSTPYTGGVSGTLQATGGSVTWPATAAFTIASGSSSTTVNLQASTTTPTVLGVASSTPAASNALICNFGSPACTFTAANAGFIVAAAANGAAATVPTQTAGTASAGYFLRAVQTNTSTKACEAAIVGVGNVNWSVTCNNPTTCSAGNLMTLTGNAGVAIAGNANGSTASSTAVAMTFDANGNAPFSFNYANVGQVTLNASRAAGGSLLTALSGSSNAFVVKPAGFALSTIRQTAAPALVNPAATSAAGSAFVRAGESFSATVTARTSGGATTPNYGRETAPEGVLLRRALVLPAGGASGTLSNGTIAGGSFTAGVATVSNLAFSEVGVITLSPAVADGDYLGAGNVTGTTSANIGRFFPAQFALSGGSVTHRVALSCSPASAFTYLGENFLLGLTLTAQNTAGATTANYSGAFAKLDPTSAAGWNVAGLGGTTTFSTGSGRLSLGTATGSWANGVASNVALTANASRGSAADGPFSATFGVAPTDSDGVTMRTFNMASTSSGTADRTSVSTVPLRFGRLRMANAVGGQSRALSLPLTAQYWAGTAFDTNTLDSCTAIAATHVSFGNLRKTLTTADTSVSGSSFGLSSGVGALKIGAPLGGRYGTVDVTLSLGSSAADASCLQPWTTGNGDAATAGANLSFLRGAWCGSTYVNDPSARASFGLYRGADAMIFQRENY